MKIKEENMSKIMNLKFIVCKDWIKVFDEIYLEIKEDLKESPYSSMEYNLTPIFIYELIKNKSNIDDFSKVYKHILGKLNKVELENTYSRFFDSYNNNNTDISLLKYIKHDRFKNNFSIWDNMIFIFKNIEIIDNIKKITFDKSTFPYLHEMLSHVNETNILTLYAGGLHSFLRSMSANLTSLIPVIKIAESNSAYLVEKKGYNHNLINTILHIVSEMSYDLKEEDNLKNFNILNENISDFKKIYKACFIINS